MKQNEREEVWNEEDERCETTLKSQEVKIEISARSIHQQFYTRGINRIWVYA